MDVEILYQGSGKTARLVSVLHINLVRQMLAAAHRSAPDGPCRHCGRIRNHARADATGPRPCRRARSAESASQHWRRDGSRIRTVLDDRCRVTALTGRSSADGPVPLLSATTGFVDHVPPTISTPAGDQTPRTPTQQGGSGTAPPDDARPAACASSRLMVRAPGLPASGRFRATTSARAQGRPCGAASRCRRMRLRRTQH
jgi:hypothetical protein